MDNFWSLFGVVAALQGVLLSLILFSSKKLDGPKKVLLSFLVFFFSLYLAEFSGYWTELLRDNPQFAFTTTSIPWLFGPLIYYLSKEYVHPGSHYRIRSFSHLFPFLLSFIVNSPVFFKNGEEKLILLGRFIYTDSPEMSIEFYISSFTMFSVILIYCYASLRLIKALNSVQKVFVSVLILGIAIFAGQGAVRVLIIYTTDYQYISSVGLILVCTSGFLIYGLTYMAISNPKLLMDVSSTKYKNNRLSQGRYLKVKNALVVYFTRENFRRPEFGLAIISKDLGIPTHFISQVVNTEYNVGISELINSYRIEDVKDKLVDEKFKHYKILALAKEAGFSTKASFYNSFKKLEGCTPTEYINRKRNVLDHLSPTRDIELDKTSLATVRVSVFTDKVISSG